MFPEIDHETEALGVLMRKLNPHNAPDIDRVLLSYSPSVGIYALRVVYVFGPPIDYSGKAKEIGLFLCQLAGGFRGDPALFFAARGN